MDRVSRKLRGSPNSIIQNAKLHRRTGERATNLLKMHAKSHEALAELLLQYETLTGEEVQALVLEGEMPVRDELGQVIKKKKADDVKDAAAATATRPRRFAARS